MSEWVLVGGTPARGDSDGVQRLAASVDSTADAAFDAKVSLGRVGAGMSSSLWEGAAATKFVSVFSPLGPDLGRMAESYSRAAAALRTYASELAQIRGEAEQALTRARLAKATADREGPALEGARGRIRSLTRQMTEVSSDVRAKTRTLSTCTDPAQRDLLYDSIWRSRQYHGRLSRQYSDARAQEGQHQRALDEANDSLRRQRDLIDSLRHDHRRAEERAAQRIRDALDHSLRNKSNFEKIARGAVAPVVAGFGAVADVAVGLATGEYDAVLHRVRNFLGDLSFYVGLITIAVTILSFAFPPLGIVAAGLVLAGVALQATKFVLTAHLLGSVDPATGEAVDLVDLGFDGLSLGLSVFAIGGTAKHLAHIRSHALPAGKDGLTLMIKRPLVLHRGAFHAAGTAQPAYVKAYSSYVIEKSLTAVDLAERFVPIKKSVRDAARAVQRGISTPIARPCTI